jgi:hypothetical protein
MTMRLDQLAGTRVEGVLQIAEAALNDLLGHVRTGHTVPTLELEPENSILIRYGVLHAHASLPASVTPSRSPHVTLVLRSLLVAIALRAVVHRRYIHVHGRHLTIDLAAVPGLESWREWWAHVHHVGVQTTRHTLQLQFAVAIINRQE